MTRSRDHIDQLVDEWARVRREVIGIKHPLRSADYLGSPRCTLGSSRDLHAGSRSEGRVEQHWPEFPYQGNAALVNWLFWRATPTFKEMMDWHWVALAPRSKSIRADLMGISARVYWDRVARVKCYIEGGLVVTESVRTVVPIRGGINPIRAGADSAHA
jgi:hypothetical protein